MDSIGYNYFVRKVITYVEELSSIFMTVDDNDDDDGVITLLIVSRRKL